MPHPCVVCGRSRMNPNNRDEEYMFFSFPVNDETRCRRWLEFCCREDLYRLSRKQLLQRMVCSKHFQPQDFLTEFLDRLQSTAIPSVYDPTQSLYNITCTLCNKSRQDPPTSDYDGTTFHHFPGEEFRCLKWLDFVGVESYYRLTRKEILYCYICSNHFDRSQFIPGYKGRLIEKAVPSIRYPKEVVKSELTVAELPAEPKLFAAPERCKKPSFLSTEILESKACAACGRSRKDPRNKLEHYKFHPFPAYEIGRCLRWCQFLGREDLLSMSPNQIRKLVLCSRHFQTGQNFQKNPCDAVPTIKDVSKSLTPAVPVNVEEQYLNENTNKPKRTRHFSMPLVSSKKPKVDNKPAPLAKKRGKSRRPTSINIPKPDFVNIENRIVRKLPLPSSANWKIQLNEQSVAVNNIVSSVTTPNSQADGHRKVIMPITWDISNLGAPIPVHSLSSMPPGLLIKINLPEQGQQKEQQKSTTIKKQKKTTNKSASKEQNWPKNNGQTPDMPQIAKSNVDTNLMEFLSIPPEKTFKVEELQVDHEEMVLPHSLQILTEEGMQIKENQYCEKLETNAKKKRVKRRKVTNTMKRTTFPITCEINRFLTKLTPLMHRLPKRARAQIKLSIVNMVIDHL